MASSVPWHGQVMMKEDDHILRKTSKYKVYLTIYRYIHLIVSIIHIYIYI